MCYIINFEEEKNWVFSNLNIKSPYSGKITLWTDMEDVVLLLQPYFELLQVREQLKESCRRLHENPCK